MYNYNFSCHVYIGITDDDSGSVYTHIHTVVNFPKSCIYTYYIICYLGMRVNSGRVWNRNLYDKGVTKHTIRLDKHFKPNSSISPAPHLKISIQNNSQYIYIYYT